ncbi:hypothetical protein [Dyella sp.]|uniref:hypothetical protein n=1 Tax=Dyella sp. TaxID=1869338 RepID=UPI002849FC2F|nr:hypothetical protein [Dyella sp.]MDR3445148.1 hypothetical protein [Dyella sp.]
MDHVLRAVRARLTAVATFLVLMVGASPAAQAATMPAIQPIAVQPVGSSPGNGIATRVTYQVGGAAANDVGVAAAANEASYITRGVAMSGGTVGGIIRGGVAAGSRFLGWVSVAIAAYQLYKWYTDPNGDLMQPGQNVPSYNCGGGDYWGIDIGSTACSLPGVQALLNQWYAAQFPTFHFSGASCVDVGGGVARCSISGTTNTGADREYVNAASFAHNAPPSTVDIAYSTAATPVTNDQLAGLAQQHPDWWPHLFTDPMTGNVVVNPDIADDMTHLQQELAPKYGVDPQTLSPVQPDPNYGTEQGSPKQTDLPQYCAWASAACDYYKFVEDNWPDAQKKQYSDSPDCKTPPGCSGDDILCGAALEAFRTRCAVANLSGDEPPTDTPEHGVRDLYGPDVDLGDMSKLDMSGFGLSTSCPFNNFDFTYADATVHVPLDFICTYGIGLRVLVLLSAAMSCAYILGLGVKGWRN